MFEGTVDGAAERFTTEIAGVRVGQWRHIVIKMTYEDGERVPMSQVLNEYLYGKETADQ